MTARTARMSALMVAMAAAGAIGGCAGYSNYPKIEGNTASNDPNSSSMTAVMVVALQWTIEKHPVDGPYAVNLPEGMLRKRVDSVFARLDDPNARPITPDTVDLPTYHVARIQIRESNAEVDIIRPVTTVKGPGGAIVYQTVTVFVKGGLHPWAAESERAYMIGIAEPPPPHFIPGGDKPPLGPAVVGQATP